MQSVSNLSGSRALRRLYFDKVFQHAHSKGDRIPESITVHNFLNFFSTFSVNNWSRLDLSIRCAEFHSFFLKKAAQVYWTHRKQQHIYIKIGTIQRRLAWPLCKDDTQTREPSQIFNNLKSPGHTFATLPGGRASRRSVIACSSYIEPGTAPGISRCSLVVERRNK